MNGLNNTKTSVKLIASFVVVAIITLVVAYVGYVNMKTINDGLGIMYNDRLVY